MHFVYIIYSSTIRKYYVGETSDLDNRLAQHRSAFFENSFTAKTKDWQLFWSLACDNIIQARAVEAHIKNMKSLAYIHNIKTHPEISEKLKIKYSNK